MPAGQRAYQGVGGHVIGQAAMQGSRRACGRACGRVGIRAGGHAGWLASQRAGWHPSGRAGIPAGGRASKARWPSGKLRPEYAEYLNVMVSHREYQNVASIAEQQFEAYEATAMAGTTRPPYRFPDIDLHTPTSLPTQKQLSRVLHRIAAADLMQNLVASAPVAASWHISCSLPGSGLWLHTMLYVSRVAAKTWLAYDGSDSRGCWY